MSYIIVLLLLLSILGSAYVFMSRKQALEAFVENDDEPIQSSSGFSVHNHNEFSEWESVLIRAMDHIYSGAHAGTEQQATHVYAEPPALARTAMANLFKAFDRVGTLHSTLTELDNPDVSMKELGNLVARDPLLSSRVLKTVNSPFFRTASNVKSIHTAVNILGLVNLKNLIAFGTMPYALYRDPEHRRMFTGVWQHMNSTAITASFMARARQDIDSGILYTAGLMHDIGKLVLILLIKAPAEGEAYPRCLQREYDRLSTTHIQAAQVMAQNGGIPAQLRSLVLDHHLPALIPVQDLECDSVHATNLTALFLANQVAKLVSPSGTLLDDVGRLDRLDPSYREIISKEEAREIFLSPGLIDDVLANFRTVQALLN